MHQLTLQSTSFQPCFDGNMIGRRSGLYSYSFSWWDRCVFELTSAAVHCWRSILWSDMKFAPVYFLWDMKELFDMTIAVLSGISLVFFPGVWDYREKQNPSAAWRRRCLMCTGNLNLFYARGKMVGVRLWPGMVKVRMASWSVDRTWTNRVADMDWIVTATFPHEQTTDTDTSTGIARYGRGSVAQFVRSVSDTQNQSFCQSIHLKSLG